MQAPCGRECHRGLGAAAIVRLGRAGINEAV